MKYLYLLLLILVTPAWGETLPAPGHTWVTNQLNWYKWDTKNFIILSLNNSQGQDVAEHIETLKTWTVVRWGLSDIALSQKCKILCVPHKSYLESLFRLRGSFAEIKFNDKFFIEDTACWVVCDDTLVHSLSVFVTDIMLTEMEQKYGIKIGYWAHKGMSILNGESGRIRYFLFPLANHMANKNNVYCSESMFTTVNTSGFSQANSILFDMESTILCLMLRKEFGGRNFLSLITNSSPLQLHKSTGYNSYSEFDAAFNRYLRYASDDIAKGRMPEVYLKIGD